LEPQGNVALFGNKKKSDLMKKLETLKKNYEFKNVLSRGKFYCGKFITVYIVKNNLQKNVIGIAVNTKVAKAVKRNRIKRLIRENYRLSKSNLKTGFNIVFLWNKKASIDNVDFHAVEHDMSKIFDKANLLLIGNYEKDN